MCKLGGLCIRRRRNGSICVYTGLHRGGLHKRQKYHSASIFIFIFIVDYIGEVNQLQYLFFLLEAKCELPCDAWKPAILHHSKRWYTCPKMARTFFTRAIFLLSDDTSKDAGAMLVLYNVIKSSPPVQYCPTYALYNIIIYNYVHTCIQISMVMV
jgi:hypothetical protein